jgi:hypothetical protein
MSMTYSDRIVIVISKRSMAKAAVNKNICATACITSQPSRQEKTLTMYVSMNTGYVAFQRKK